MAPPFLARNARQQSLLSLSLSLWRHRGHELYLSLSREGSGEAPTLTSGGAPLKKSVCMGVTTKQNRPPLAGAMALQQTAKKILAPTMRGTPRRNQRPKRGAPHRRPWLHALRRRRERDGPCGGGRKRRRRGGARCPGSAARSSAAAHRTARRQGYSWRSFGASGSLPGAAGDERRESVSGPRIKNRGRILRVLRAAGRGAEVTPRRTFKEGTQSGPRPPPQP